MPTPPRRLLSWRNAAALLLAAAIVAGCVMLPAPSGDFTGPVRCGRTAAQLDELSGLAPSRRSDDLLWANNDSGAAPELEAIDRRGTRLGTLRIVDAAARDWEDLASFTHDGQAWLLIADVGDNEAVRHDVVLYVVPEPARADLRPDRPAEARVAWRIPFAYEDGPRDCEAVAVDAEAGRIFLLSKRTQPPALYWLPLRPAPATAPCLAKKLTPVRAFPPPNEAQRLIPAPSGRFRAMPTAMDFSPDGKLAAVLTYGDVWLFPRAPGQSWAEALGGTARRLAPHDLVQAEALCFSRDGRALFVGGEGKGSALLRYDAP